MLIFGMRGKPNPETPSHAAHGSESPANMLVHNVKLNAGEEEAG